MPHFHLQDSSTQPPLIDAPSMEWGRKALETMQKELLQEDNDFKILEAYVLLKHHLQMMNRMKHEYYHPVAHLIDASHPMVKDLVEMAKTAALMLDRLITVLEQFPDARERVAKDGVTIPSIRRLMRSFQATLKEVAEPKLSQEDLALITG